MKDERMKPGRQEKKQERVRKQNEARKAKEKPGSDKKQEKRKR